MTATILAMTLILAVAAGTAGVVVIGMQGRGRARAPKLADQLARTAQHLNGDGEPPQAFARLKF